MGTLFTMCIEEGSYLGELPELTYLDRQTFAGASKPHVKEWIATVRHNRSTIVERIFWAGPKGSPRKFDVPPFDPHVPSSGIGAVLEFGRNRVAGSTKERYRAYGLIRRSHRQDDYTTILDVEVFPKLWDAVAARSTSYSGDTAPPAKPAVEKPKAPEKPSIADTNDDFTKKLAKRRALGTDEAEKLIEAVTAAALKDPESDEAKKLGQQVMDLGAEKADAAVEAIVEALGRGLTKAAVAAVEEPVKPTLHELIKEMLSYEPAMRFAGVQLTPELSKWIDERARNIAQGLDGIPLRMDAARRMAAADELDDLEATAGLHPKVLEALQLAVAMLRGV